MGLFSGFAWPLPAAGKPGSWVESSGPVQECLSGVHACRVHDLPHWIDDELWTIELAGGLVERPTLIVAPRGRLLDRVEGWSEGTAREFAEACAGRARDQAVRRLRAAGLAEEAAELGEAAGLDAIEEGAAWLALWLSGEGAEAAAFAADAVALARGRRPETWAQPSVHGGLPAQSPGRRPRTSASSSRTPQGARRSRWAGTTRRPSPPSGIGRRVGLPSGSNSPPRSSAP